MRWITANDLESWARSLEARNQLPMLVSDLLRASAPDIAAIRFPSGDKGQVRGFDGNLESGIATLNVPEGRSYWEFGTNGGYQSKAKDDFNKRTGEVAPAVRAETTFVFVSPWTWDSSDRKNKLEDFIDRCKAGSGWKDVRYIDGVALETWLTANPAVAAWHARNTLKIRPAEGIRSTDEFWAQYAGQFNPPLQEAVVLCEREEAAKNLVLELSTQGATASLTADSQEEAVAFAIAAIRTSPPETRLFLEARTLVVDTTEAGRQLPRDNSLVLLLRNEPAKAPSQFAAMATFVPLGRLVRGVTAPELLRPSTYAMAQALRKMDFDEQRATTLSLGSGRSLSALARMIPSGSYDPPTWEQNATDLAPAILAGAWDSSNARDRSVLEMIAPNWTSLELESQIRRHLGDSDPPFDLLGSIWKVRAPMDAFVRIGPVIDQGHAERLKAAMLEVFSATTPPPDPDAEIGRTSSTPAQHSTWLRDGLATTLLLFANWSETARVNIGAMTGQAFADDLVRSIPGLGSDVRILNALRDQLPMLAEAAPVPLLSALERMLEGDGAAIAPIFNERAGWLYSESDHYGVVWALETLAWDPAYFRRAVLVLARLAAIDPHRGGNSGPRPDTSLSEIFLLWHPNTNASSDLRFAVLDEIVRDFPEIGWSLVLELLPAMHGASSPTARPRLRDAGASQRKPMTYRQLWADQASICQRAVALAANDADRWRELIPRLSQFPPPERASAVAALEGTLGQLAGEPLEALWLTLRKEVQRHEAFRQAAWALPESELAALRTLVERFMPTDPVLKYVPLFEMWELGQGGDRATNANQRVQAVGALFESYGAAGVLGLAARVHSHYGIVEAMHNAAFGAADVQAVLDAAFKESPDAPMTRMLAGLHRRVAGETAALEWLQRRRNDGLLSDAILAQLLHAWPDTRATWRVVRSFGAPIDAAYWSAGEPHALSGSRREMIEASLQLLRYGRAVEALQSTSLKLGVTPTLLIVRMLDGLVGQINARRGEFDTMTSFYAEKALEALDTRPDISDERIGGIELRLYRLLEHSNRELKLYAALARNADLYHSLLINVYLAEGVARKEGPADPQVEAAAGLSWSILHHFERLPGAEGADIDVDALRAWIDRLRELALASGHRAIGDDHVGKILAHAPPDPQDHAWPHRAVRGELERIASEEAENGLRIERFNMRGAHMRGLFDGGAQERDLAEANYRWAQVAVAWPRTSALLRSIADMWMADAKRADEDAAQRRLMN
jgi:hypothetical protein